MLCTATANPTKASSLFTPNSTCQETTKQSNVAFVSVGMLRRPSSTVLNRPSHTCIYAHTHTLCTARWVATVGVDASDMPWPDNNPVNRFVTPPSPCVTGHPALQNTCQLSPSLCVWAGITVHPPSMHVAMHSLLCSNELRALMDHSPCRLIVATRLPLKPTSNALFPLPTPS
jgi:hypothetical protein